MTFAGDRYDLQFGILFPVLIAILNTCFIRVIIECDCHVMLQSDDALFHMGIHIPATALSQDDSVTNDMVCWHVESVEFIRRCVSLSLTSR